MEVRITGINSEGAVGEMIKSPEANKNRHDSE